MRSSFVNQEIFFCHEIELRNIETQGKPFNGINCDSLENGCSVSLSKRYEWWILYREK